MKILGVKVDNLNRSKILEKVENFLSENKFHQIATVNPEFILRAGKDQEFKNILNNCDLNIADGFGIKLAFWRYGKKIKCRLAGIDLMQEILRLASENNLSIFLAANSRGLSNWELTRDAIHKIYPSLEIDGKNFDFSVIASEEKQSPRSLDYARDGKDYIKSFDIVFANFGAPYQEKFLNSLKNANIKMAMGVGGSFDYLTGKVPRAPKFMRQMGLEWLFRLFVQPNRWKRIWNAVIVFPIKIIFNKYNG